LVGPKQVGGATCAAWREILVPALREHREWVRVWPFDGSLHELVRKGTLTIAETYPGELYAHLGIQGGHKRNASWRRAAGLRVLMAARGEPLDLAGVRNELATGFGDEPTAEDRFDAVIGAVAMSLIAAGRDDEGFPEDERVRRVEGWMLGLRTQTG
jgi:hypothetical protein